jgi:hypothetical protein
MKRVFIVSYPRSGNMLVRTLLAHVAFPDRKWTTKDITTMFAVDLYHSGRSVMDWYTEPRLYKSHALYSETIEPVLYIYRHGLAVCNSLYNRLSRRPRFKMSWEDYYEWFLRGHKKWGKWSEHVETWMFFRTKKIPFLSFKYEDIVLNPVPEVRKMLNFLGWYRTEEEIDEAICKTHNFYQTTYKGQSKRTFIDFEYHQDFNKKNRDLLNRLGYEL